MSTRLLGYERETVRTETLVFPPHLNMRPTQVPRHEYKGIALEWKPQDLWVGVYWQDSEYGGWDVYVCLLPMLPIHVYWHGKAE